MRSTQIHIQQNRCFSSEQSFDFGEVRHPEDAIFLFRVTARLNLRRSSVVCVKNLLSAVVKIKQYSFALHLFDKMLQRSDPVDSSTLAAAVDCFCRLKRVDVGFSILVTRFKCGIGLILVSFTNFIKGFFMIGEVLEVGELYDSCCERNCTSLMNLSIMPKD